MISAYQYEVANNKASSNEIIEFKNLTEKIYHLCNKKINTGTPSFKNSKNKSFFGSNNIGSYLNHRNPNGSN